MLFENRREAATGYLQGVTDNYIRVFAPGPDAAKDRVRPVRLVRVDGDRMIGEPVDSDVIDGLESHLVQLI